MLCCDCLDQIREEPPGVFVCECGPSFVVRKVGMLGAVEVFKPQLPELQVLR